MPDLEKVTACALVFGNEVLSGRTKYANLNWMASRCTEIGIFLAEARVLPDVEEVIVAAINECRIKYDYVFTDQSLDFEQTFIQKICKTYVQKKYILLQKSLFLVLFSTFVDI